MPAHKKRFCPSGHDTYLVGRREQGSCKECCRLWALEYQRRLRLDPEWRAKKNAGRRERYANDPAYREEAKLKAMLNGMTQIRIRY